MKSTEYSVLFLFKSLEKQFSEPMKWTQLYIQLHKLEIYQ